MLTWEKLRLIRGGNIFPTFCCPFFIILWKLRPQFPVLCWQNLHLVWSSATVANLLQGSTCCAIIDALHYLGSSECLFELVLPCYQFEAVWVFCFWFFFLPKICWSLEILFFLTILCNPSEMVMWENPQKIRSFWNPPSCLPATTMVLRLPFFHILMHRLTFSRSSLT